MRSGTAALAASPAFPRAGVLWLISGEEELGTLRDSWSCKLMVNRPCLSESLVAVSSIRAKKRPGGGTQAEQQQHDWPSDTENPVQIIINH